MLQSTLSVAVENTLSERPDIEEKDVTIPETSKLLNDNSAVCAQLDTHLFTAESTNGNESHLTPLNNCLFSCFSQNGILGKPDDYYECLQTVSKGASGTIMSQSHVIKCLNTLSVGVTVMSQNDVSESQNVVSKYVSGTIFESNAVGDGPTRLTASEYVSSGIILPSLLSPAIEVPDIASKDASSAVMSHSSDCLNIEKQSTTSVTFVDRVIISEIAGKSSIGPIVSRENNTTTGTLRKTAISKCVNDMICSNDFSTAASLNMMTVSDCRFTAPKDLTSDGDTKTRNVGKYRMMAPQKMQCAENAKKTRVANRREICKPELKAIGSACSNVANYVITSEKGNENGQKMCNFLNDKHVGGNVTAPKVQKHSTKNAAGKSTTSSISLNATSIECSKLSSFDQYSCSGYMKKELSVKTSEADSMVVSLINSKVSGSCGSESGARNKEAKITEQSTTDPYGYYHYDQYSTEGVKGKKGPLYRGPLSSKMTKRKYLSADQDTATGLSKSSVNKPTSQKTSQPVKEVKKCAEKEVERDLVVDKELYSDSKKHDSKREGRAAKARYENRVHAASAKDKERYQTNK